MTKEQAIELIDNNAEVMDFYKEIDKDFHNLVEETKKNGANTWQFKNQYKYNDGWKVDLDADDWDIVLVGYNDGRTEELSLCDFIKKKG